MNGSNDNMRVKTIVRTPAAVYGRAVLAKNCAKTTLDSAEVM